MSKVGEAVMSYVSSTSKVWMYCLTLLMGLTGTLLAVELYHERTLYQRFHDPIWTARATWALLFSLILVFETALTCLCVCLDKNKIIKRYITTMNLVNVVAIGALLLFLPYSSEVKRRSKFMLGEAMKIYSFVPLPSNSESSYPTPSGSSYSTGLQMTPTYPARLFQTAQPPPPGMIVGPGIQASTQLWDYLQSYYKCCGIEEEREWLRFSPQGKYYPWSCCSLFSIKEQRNDALLCREVDQGFKKHGCLKPIKTLHLVSLATFVVAILLSLLLAAVSYVQGLRYEEYAK